MVTGAVLRTVFNYGVKCGVPTAGLFAGIAYRKAMARGIERLLPYSPLDTFVSELEKEAKLLKETLVKKLKAEKLTHLEAALTDQKIIDPNRKRISMKELLSEKIGKDFSEKQAQHKKMHNTLQDLRDKMSGIKFEDFTLPAANSSRFHLPGVGKNDMSITLEEKQAIQGQFEALSEKINECVKAQFEEIDDISIKHEFQSAFNERITAFEKEMKNKYLKNAESVKESKKTSKSAVKDNNAIKNKEGTLSELNKQKDKLKEELTDLIKSNISVHEQKKIQFEQAEKELLQLWPMLEKETKTISSKNLKQVMNKYPEQERDINSFFKTMNIDPGQGHELEKLKPLRENCTQGKKLNEWVSWFTGYIPFNQKIIDGVDNSHKYMSGLCSYDTVETKLSQWGSSLMDKLRNAGSSIWYKLTFTKAPTVE